MPGSGSFTKRQTEPKPSKRAGEWIKQGTGIAAYLAFVPRPLPPDPPVRMDEVTGKSRNRLFVYQRYLDVLNQDASIRR